MTTLPSLPANLFVPKPTLRAAGLSGKVSECPDESAATAAKPVGVALSPGFREGLARTVSLYGAGNASAAIVARLRSDLPRVQKPFFDIDHAH